MGAGGEVLSKLTENGRRRWSMGGGGGENKEPLFQMKHTFSLLGNSGGDNEHANDDGQSNPSKPLINFVLSVCSGFLIH